MAVTIQCPGCQSVLSASDELAGNKMSCPACMAVVDVPRAAGAPNAITGPPSPDSASPLLPRQEAGTEAATAIAPAAAPSPTVERPHDPIERPSPGSRQTKPRSPTAMWLIAVPVTGILVLSFCCIGSLVATLIVLNQQPEAIARLQMAKRAEARPVPGKPEADLARPAPPPLPNDGAFKPAPPPPPETGPPEPMQLDAAGAGEAKGFLHAAQQDPRTDFHPCKRCRFDAQADAAYLVEVTDAHMADAELRLEPADGGPTIRPLVKPGQLPRKNRVAFFAPKAQPYTVAVIGLPVGAHGNFTLRIRPLDEHEALPDHLKIPLPDASVPKVVIAREIPNSRMSGGAFAPDNKTFWTATSSALILWDHQSLAQRGQYSLGKSLLRALAVDGKGRLYGQRVPWSPINVWTPVVGAIEIFDGLDPKGDAGPLPAPTRTIELRGIVQRLIASPDGRWLYFLDTHNRQLGRIDTQTATVDKTNDRISAGARALCLVPGGKKLYCCADPHRIDVVDAATLQVERSVDLGQGQVKDIAATDKGMVFVLNSVVGTEGNVQIVDLSGPPNAKPAMAHLRTDFYDFLQMAPDQKTLFASGDRRVGAFVIPFRPLWFDMPGGDYGIQQYFSAGWTQISPDGRTILHDLGVILSVSR
jgi:hypothetical protein